jgi:hypothetical protein
MDEIQVCIGDEKRVLPSISRDDWNDLRDPCPCCGNREFRHFETTGGRYGRTEGTPVRQSDYWDANQSLYTQCLGCEEVLHKHPVFDLLFTQ